MLNTLKWSTYKKLQFTVLSLLFKIIYISFASCVGSKNIKHIQLKITKSYIKVALSVHLHAFTFYIGFQLGHNFSAAMYLFFNLKIVVVTCYGHVSLLTKFQLWWYMHMPKSIKTKLNGTLIIFRANCPPQYTLAEYDCSKSYLPTSYICNFLWKLRPDGL